MESLWVTQEVNNFANLFFRLVAAGHIGKGHCVVVLVHHARFALTEAKGAAFAAALHLAHEINPNANQEQHRSPADQESHEERALLARLHIKLDVVGQQITNQSAVEVGCSGSDTAIVIGDRNDLSAVGTF